MRGAPFSESSPIDESAERARPSVALVMPMAGRGSRFSREGVERPKPLIDLHGRPFFSWAAESVRRLAPVREAVFVVLDEHVRRFAIDEAIRRSWPDATVVALPEVTSGAAETAAIGVRALRSDGPIAICDSDHAFELEPGGDPLADLDAGDDAALLCFRSQDPAYSYVRLRPGGGVAGTVEKRVVSPFAIAGCYLFSSPRLFLEAWQADLAECAYEEHFVSGLYNRLIEAGGRVGKHLLGRHFSFGTPAELAHLAADGAALEAWLEAA